MVGCLRFSIGIFTILCMVSFSAWAGKGKQIAWEDQAGRQKPNLHFRIHEKVENKKVLFNNGVKYLKGTLGTDGIEEHRYISAETLFSCDLETLNPAPGSANNMGWMCINERIHQNLNKDKRYERALRYFRDSKTSTAKINEALMYIYGFIGNELSKKNLYKAIKSLLKKANNQDANKVLKWYEENELPLELRPTRWWCW